MKGDLPFDELRNSFDPVPDDFTSTVQVLIAEAYWHLHHGRTAEAVDAAQLAVDIVGADLRTNSFTSCAFSTLAKCLRHCSHDVSESNPRQSVLLRQRGWKAARRAVRIAQSFVPELPEALREFSLALAAKGRVRKAWQYAQKSCTVADEQKARYEHAQSLLVCGQLAQQLGRPEATEQIEQAQTALEEFKRSIAEAVSGEKRIGVTSGSA